MRSFFRRPAVLISAAVLAVLFLARPSAYHLQSRVVRSISTTLGRAVEVSSVHWRFLPRPAFELENVVIHDEPAFGAEPLLRSPEVIASLRIGSLLRGRILISSLNLSDASLNLTRSANGEWNIEDLLQRTSSINVAPTGSGHRAAEPAFPYIEATDARVNFKSGEEKLHFALTDAKFAVWQESENSWGMRVQARPIRTDANLTDTGVIKLTGTWQRSAFLHQTPVQFAWDWSRGQIGQVSKLVSGNDPGWRGEIELSGQASGTPDALNIKLDNAIDDFRRQDVLVSDDLKLGFHCGGNYSLVSASISNLDCTAASGEGTLELTGDLGAGAAFSLANYDLRLRTVKLPAQSFLNLVHHASGNVAPNLRAEGSADLNVHLTRDDQGTRAEGGGKLNGLILTSPNGDGQLAVGAAPLVVTCSGCPASSDPQGREASRQIKLKRSAITPVGSSPELLFAIGPVSVPMGRTNPLQAQATFSKTGYQAWLRGDANIKRLLRAAGALNIPVQRMNADGSATVDLKAAGGWGEPLKATGSAQLRSVYAIFKGVNAPLNIARADLVLNQDAIHVSNLSASLAEATWHGSLTVPRPCAAPRDCEIDFNLHSAQLHASALNRLFNPALAKKSWYEFLSSADGSPYFLQSRAKGDIAIDDLLLGGADCSHFKAKLQLDQGRVKLTSATAEMFGGTASGNWEAQFTASPPQYKGSGELSGVALADVAALMRDGWMEGSGDAEYQFSAAGWNIRDLLQSAELKADFSIADGLFPHIVLANNSGPLRANAFSGSLQLHQAEISFRDTKFETPRRAYTMTGTASLVGGLDLKFVGEGSSEFAVSGTIFDGKVFSNPTTAAALKP